MGAGTGPLIGGQKHEVVLTFTTAIEYHDARYTNFKSALQWLLQGLPSRLGNIVETDIVETRTGEGHTLVSSIKVTVTGPLPDPTNFNRAFNRLLWGVQHKKSPVPGTSSSVTIITPEYPNKWRNEDT